MTRKQKIDVAVIGGGLAGLTAAAFLARGGAAVTLFEKAHDVGGRAATQNAHGFHFNFGPHALYRGGAAELTLGELGVPFSGRAPNVSGGYAVENGAKQTFPVGFFSLLTTGLLGLPGKLETGRMLAGIGNRKTSTADHVSVREWLQQTIHQDDARRLIEALLRVATYANDPERQSAGAALAQLRAAITNGVLYLDGGWQTLVDGLRAVAIAAGAEIVTGSKVVAVEPTSSHFLIHRLNPEPLAAAAVIIAAGPQEASTLVVNGHATALGAWARSAIPVRAACLDLALERLPQPRATFALGIDAPLYFSVHSAAAQLAPEGSALIHAAKYLSPHEPFEPLTIVQELEQFIDLIQPGWRGLTVERRFLPQMTVSHALVTAAQGGLAGRPGPAVPGFDNLYVAGDWVGPEGMLSDASVASGKLAAQLALKDRQRRAIAA